MSMFQCLCGGIMAASSAVYLLATLCRLGRGRGRGRGRQGYQEI